LHVPVFLLLKDWLRDLPDIAAVAIVLAITIPLALLSNRLFEMPIRRAGSELLQFGRRDAVQGQLAPKA
jgi:peptidoglycan/LPS O-acetylase OafA/YrhL